jgi:hypothetical protein
MTFRRVLQSLGIYAGLKEDTRGMTRRRNPDGPERMGHKGCVQTVLLGLTRFPPQKGYERTGKEQPGDNCVFS